MKVILTLKSLKIKAMENATINIGKNWLVTSPPRDKDEERKQA